MQLGYELGTGFSFSGFGMPRASSRLGIALEHYATGSFPVLYKAKDCGRGHPQCDSVE